MSRFGGIGIAGLVLSVVLGAFLGLGANWAVKAATTDSADRKWSLSETTIE